MIERARHLGVHSRHPNATTCALWSTVRPSFGDYSSPVKVSGTVTERRLIKVATATAAVCILAVSCASHSASTAVLAGNTTSSAAATSTPTDPTAPSTTATSTTDTGTTAISTTDPSNSTDPTAPEPLPSIAEEAEITPTPTSTPSQPTIVVRAPTLGANFSGDGDWHLDQNGPLTTITVFTQGGANTPNIRFRLYSLDGVENLTYTGAALTPDGTYFALQSNGCAGQPLPMPDQGDGGCQQLSFDPTTTASAADPFNAQLLLRFQLTCVGQGYSVCQQTPSASSADPDHPLVLDFSQSGALHGATECDPTPIDSAPPCATSSGQSADVDPSGDSSSGGAVGSAAESSAVTVVSVEGTSMTATSG